MAPHLIATPKAEETFFSLLIQISKHLVFLFNVFFHEFFKLLKASKCSKYQILWPEWAFCFVNWRFVCH